MHLTRRTIDEIGKFADIGAMKAPLLMGFFFLISLLGTTSAKAVEVLTWADLEPHMNVTLTHSLNVPDFSLPAGTDFTILESDTLDAGVQVIDAHFTPCPTTVQNRQIDLQMVDANYGFELHSGCNVSLYLELKDFYQPSYFEGQTE